MKKYTILAIVAVLLVAVFAFSGCGTQGTTGPAGAAGTNADYTVVQTMIDAAIADIPEGTTVTGSSAALVWDGGDAQVICGEDIVVYGSGFPSEKTITIYFADESTGRSLKWFKVDKDDISEVGGFRVETTVPDVENFDIDIFKDVTVDANGFYALTVGAYDGTKLLTTAPLAVEQP